MADPVNKKIEEGELSRLQLPTSKGDPRSSESQSTSMDEGSISSTLLCIQKPQLKFFTGQRKHSPSGHFSGPTLNCSSFPMRRVEKYKPSYYSDHKQIMEYMATSTASTSKYVILVSSKRKSQNTFEVF